MSTTNPTKQNAGNNAFLAASRKLFNKPVYAALLVEMNRGGEAACVTWLASRGLSTTPEAMLRSIGR